MKNSIIFWGKMTLKSVLSAVLALIVYFLIFNFLMDGRVISDKGCMASIWFLAVILVGFEINRKTGGISLAIAFGATRKNAFIGYIISDIAMIVIFSGFQMLIAAYIGEKNIQAYISIIIIGAATGQAIAECMNKDKYMVLYIIVSIISVVVAVAWLVFNYIAENNSLNIPVMIFAVVYYAWMAACTERSTRKLEVMV